MSLPNDDLSLDEVKEKEDKKNEDKKTRKPPKKQFPWKVDGEFNQNVFVPLLKPEIISSNQK